MSGSPRNDRFLRACRREAVDRTPVWFLRQAGRYLPEYRELRGDRDILDACRDPDLVVEATLQPLRRMDVDAAVLFSDIMLPLRAIGVDVRIDAGVGPVVREPVRTRADVARMRALEPEADEPYLLEAVRLLRKELLVPLIGFGGAPFTLASYLIEGGPSRDHARTRALMLSDPGLWTDLMASLASLARSHLRAQVEAGAQAIQVFDSWVGAVSPGDYERAVLPWTREVFGELRELDVPTIHFGVGTGELLSLMRRAGGDVIGVDWRTPLDDAWRRVGFDRAVQGNLDPAAVNAPAAVLDRAVDDVLERAHGRPGHIFNLGHGVRPDTDPGALRSIVDRVHGRTGPDGAADRGRDGR